MREGDLVEAGQVLVRMDASLSQADTRQIGKSAAGHRAAAAPHRRRARRHVPEAAAGRRPGGIRRKCSPSTGRTARPIWTRWRSERAALSRAEQGLMRARRDEAKLRETLPIYEDQERAWKQLVDEGFAGRLQAEERKRQRIEAEQELKGQAHTIEGARASIQQSRERIAQIESTYRQDLYSERVETLARHQTLTQEWEKQAHRNELLELKAPQEGTIKDLATHTEGAVLQPGTVLMTIVPANEPLRAEVWVDNRDRGFVHEGQKVRVKVAPYPFQKYGMVEGVVKYVSADANESQRNSGPEAQNAPPTPAYQFRTIVELQAQALEADGARHKLMPGMQVDAEISLGERTVMEYLLSPVRKAFHEAGRER